MKKGTIWILTVAAAGAAVYALARKKTQEAREQDSLYWLNSAEEVSKKIQGKIDALKIAS